MPKNAELINAVARLSKEFHTIETSLAANGQGPDGIVKSITLALDKLLFAVSNNLIVGREIREGLEKSCAVAVRVFEGSGIEDDLFDIRNLLENYAPN